MNNFCDSIIDIVCEKIKEKGIGNYVSMMPMLRKEDDKLYLGTMIVNENDNVWDSNSKVKASYWTLIDINDNKIIEFNKINEKDFVNKEIKEDSLEEKKQLSKYEIKKKLQYKNYLMNDIKNDNLPILDELLNSINNKMTLDDEIINANDYLIANIEEEIDKKVSELVDLVIKQKYSFITIYYEQLLQNIIEEYKENNIINKEKMLLASKIMNNYYDAVLHVNEFFNA